MSNNTANNRDNVIKKTVRLDRSRTERAFKEGESLWDSEIERMMTLIQNHVDALNKCNEGNNQNSIDEMPRLSIGIFGSPGSGKSSLMETFVKMINSDQDSVLKGKAYSLPVIKPNVLARDEHFLYKFLATALKEDKDKKKNRESGHRDSSILTPLEQVFQEVSENLQVVNEVERKGDDDPVGVSLERLERHESGEILVEKMNQFIEELADTLVGKSSSSVIFMPVDDADLSMDTLISAISTCWRYLQHPRLIPVFTFTGRLAEELLRVHFEEKLTIKGIGTDDDKLKEASTSIFITENMAIQYLGKLFPVRNRIRMGPASARIVGAKYVSRDQKEEKEVKDLLEAVSMLLFGYPRVPIVPLIRPPLRMVTLRRQVQIVDAMHAAGIEQLMKETNTEQDGGNNDNKKLNKSWAELFDLATWSLLNAHRDVLKEIHMNLDDLYGWTPRGLRHVILDSILGMDHTERGKIIKHWRYRTEDRRSQILSLLVANVFRPRMAGEEPTGDDPAGIEKWWNRKDNKPQIQKEDENSFPLSAGLLWIIDLFIGFYLPQILAMNRTAESSEKKIGQRTGPINGTGWDLFSGPVHAVREALKNKKIFSTGMLFLNPSNIISLFNTSLAKLSTKNVDKFLYLNIWCFYGYREGRPWAAVSLWRGLGLIAQCLKLLQNREEKITEEEIEIILKKHLESALVLGNLPGEPKNSEQRTSENTPKDEEKIEVAVSNLASELTQWLNDFKEERILPVLPEPGSETTQNENEKWEQCFTRRIHGENLMNIFWQDLENKFYQKPLPNWDLHAILEEWFTALQEYLKGCTIAPENTNENQETEEKKTKEIGSLLMECPLLRGNIEDAKEAKLTKFYLEKFKNDLKQIKVETPTDNSVFSEKGK